MPKRDKIQKSTYSPGRATPGPSYKVGPTVKAIPAGGEKPVTAGVTKPLVQPRVRVGPTRIGLASSGIISIAGFGAGLDAIYGAKLKENRSGGGGGRRPGGKVNKV